MAAIAGGNVRAEMARRGIRQVHVAERLGITQQSVSARLSGRVALDVDEVAVIADLLGVEPSVLLERSAS